MINLKFLKFMTSLGAVVNFNRWGPERDSSVVLDCHIMAISNLSAIQPDLWSLRRRAQRALSG